MSIDAFLQPVIQDCCLLLGLRDVNNIIKTNDDTVALIAKNAYSVITSYCRTEFHARSAIDSFKYNETLEAILFFTYYPVIDVVEVNDDVFNINNVVILDKKTGEFYIKSILLSLEDTDRFFIKYNTGYESIDDIYGFKAALTQQIIANYHTKEIAGLSTFVSGKGEGKTASANAFTLLESVKMSLESFINYRV